MKYNSKNHSLEVFYRKRSLLKNFSKFSGKGLQLDKAYFKHKAMFYGDQ